MPIYMRVMGLEAMLSGRTAPRCATSPRDARPHPATPAPRVVWDRAELRIIAYRARTGEPGAARDVTQLTGHSSGRGALLLEVLHSVCVTQHTQMSLASAAHAQGHGQAPPHFKIFTVHYFKVVTTLARGGDLIPFPSRVTRDDCGAFAVNLILPKRNNDIYKLKITQNCCHTPCLEPCLSPGDAPHEGGKQRDTHLDFIHMPAAHIHGFKAWFIHACGGRYDLLQEPRVLVWMHL